MLLRVQPHDLVIRCKPGKQMELADALSRLSPEEKHGIPDLNVEIHEACTQFSTNILEKIRITTGANPELVALRKQAYQG